MRKYLIIACLLLVIAVGFLFNKVERQKVELGRKQNNIEALNIEATQYRTESGKLAEQIRSLSLKKSELELFNSDLEETVKDLKIKLRDVKAAHTVETKLEIRTITKTIRDTIPGVYRFEYYDGWNRIAGRVSPDSTEINNSSVDSLTVINHVKQKRFLFFRIGKPKILTTVTNRNPKNRLHVTFSANFD